MRRTVARLVLPLVILAVLAGCATRPVTVGGEPAVDDFLIGAANRIAVTESAFVVVGETLLAARGEFSDERWDQIADYSQNIEDALFVARDALQQYQAVQSDDTATALTKSLSILEFLQRQYAAFKE